MAIELGTGYLSIVPSAKGLGGALADSLAGSGLAEAADKEGDKAGDGFMGKLKGKALLLTAGAGAAIGAALVVGLMGAMDQAALGDRLGAQLGLSDDESAKAGKLAGKVYAENYGDSMGDVATALRSVITDVGEGSDEWTKRTTENALTVADVFDQDVGGVTRAVGQLLRTGLVSDADEAFDVITRGFQLGDDKAGDFLDTLNEYGTQFRKVGIDGATATGLISQGLQAGARDGDLVADAIKEFSIRAVDGSKLSAQGFEAVGLNAQEMAEQIGRGGDDAKDGLAQVLDGLRGIDDPIARAAAATALFGTQSEDLGAALFALDPTTAVAGLGEVGGAAAKMGTQLSSNASASIETFKRQALMGLTNFMGSTVIPMITEHVIPAVQQMRDWFVANWPAIRDAAMPVLIALRDGFAAVAQWVADNWPQISATITEVLGTAQQVIGAAVEVITTLWANFGDNIMRFFHAAWDPLSQIVDGILQEVRGVIDIVTGLIHGDWSQVWTGIKEVFSGLWDEMEGKARLALAALQLVISIPLEVIEAAWGRVWGAVTGAFTGAWDEMSGAIGGAWDTIKTAVKGGVDDVVGFVTGIPGRIADAAKGAWDGLVNGFKGAVNLIIDGINSIKLGSIEIGGWDIPGPGPNVPSFHTPEVDPFPDLKRLAAGGLAYGPSVAMVGDNPGARTDPELIAPLSKVQGLLGGGSDPEMLGVLRQIKGRLSMPTMVQQGQLTLEQLWQLQRRSDFMAARTWSR